MDSVVSPSIAKRGETLVATRIPGTQDAVYLVIAEEALGRGIGEGSVDAIWLNGENSSRSKRRTCFWLICADSTQRGQFGVG